MPYACSQSAVTTVASATESTVQQESSDTDNEGLQHGSAAYTDDLTYEVQDTDTYDNYDSFCGDDSDDGSVVEAL